MLRTLNHRRPPSEVLLQGAWKLCCAHLRLAVWQLALQAEVQRPEAASEAGPQRRDGAGGRRVPRPQRQLLQAGSALRDPLARLHAPGRRLGSSGHTRKLHRACNCTAGWITVQPSLWTQQLLNTVPEPSGGVVQHWRRRARPHQL
jgi:hypothetical protein